MVYEQQGLHSACVLDPTSRPRVVVIILGRKFDGWVVRAS